MITVKNRASYVSMSTEGEIRVATSAGHFPRNPSTSIRAAESYRTSKIDKEEVLDAWCCRDARESLDANIVFLDSTATAHIIDNGSHSLCNKGDEARHASQRVMGENAR